MIKTIEDNFNDAMKDSKLLQTFYFELLNSDVYVIGESDVSGCYISEGDTLKLFMINDDDKNYIPVFLTIQSLEEFVSENEETPYVKSKACDLFETIKDQNVIINPKSEHPLLLTSLDINDILIKARN